MEERKLMKLGGAGAVLGGIVCLSPLVVTLLASIGLASWFGPVDAVFHIVMLVGTVALGYVPGKKFPMGHIVLYVQRLYLTSNSEGFQS